MNLQVKILVPVFLVLTFALAGIAMISANSAGRTEEAMLRHMDEKNIALANSLAYIIAENEDNLEPAKMKELAAMFRVDEVHVVDDDGILKWGNIEDFYGFDFRDGDQTAPLLVILSSPQEIAQEPQPRGTDNVMFQYISVPRIDKTGIVQVGVSMDSIEEVKSIGQSSLTTTLAFGIPAVIAVFIITMFIINWIVRKIYWYENILDSIPFPLSITDNNRKWTFINTAVENFLGKKRAEVIGQQCYNWGAAICKTQNCGIECLNRGQMSTQFNQMGMDFKVDSAYLTDAKQRKVGHIEVVQDITSMVELQKKEEALVEEIEGLSMSFVTASKHIADDSQMLAQGSADQAASMQELSASVADITAKTKTNAEMAGKASGLAGSIKSSAEKGSRQMDEMISAVRDINDASQSISKVIKTIDDIAFQTNILALNAAVEAARAGSAGKGFAVVAEEVRSLASKSADAAKDTETLIGNSMEKAEFGTRIATETASSLKEIVEGINESNEIISEIAALSEEQSNKIEQINSGIEHVAGVIQQNSATANDSANASEQMRDQASQLEELITRFNPQRRLGP